MRTRRLTRDAMLTALALILYGVEAQLPPLTPLPGIKLGLANGVTAYAAFALSGGDAAAILAARVLLGTMLTGSASALIYSASGGLLSLAVLLGLRRVLSGEQVWVAGVLGAAAHNLGQVLAAMAVTRTPGLLAYLPLLLAAGMAAGLFTGLCAQLVLKRLGGRRP